MRSWLSLDSVWSWLFPGFAVKLTFPWIQCEVDFSLDSFWSWIIPGFGVKLTFPWIRRDVDFSLDSVWSWHFPGFGLKASEFMRIYCLPFNFPVACFGVDRFHYLLYISVPYFKKAENCLVVAASRLKFLSSPFFKKNLQLLPYRYYLNWWSVFKNSNQSSEHFRKFTTFYILVLLCWKAQDFERF